MENLRDEMAYRLQLYLRIFLKRRHLFLAAVFAPLVFTILFVMIATPSYESTAVILPSEGATDVGVLGILAGVLGKSGSTVEGLPSSFLYVDILMSRAIMDGVLNAEYYDPNADDAEKKNLYQIMGFPHNQEAYENLLDKLSVKSDFETGIITLNVQASDPKLASRIANNFIISLDNFNKNIRLTQARKNLRYLERRLDDAYNEYQAVLDTLVQFQKANRGYPSISTPEVSAKAEELEMRKKTKQEIYRLLNEEFEMTKLTEAKTTPIVSVLDSASVPVEKSFPKKIPIFAFSLLFALFVLYILLFILEFKDPTSPEPQVSLEEFKDAFRDDFDSIRGVFRRTK